MAAGCPVIVKAHSSHPGTSELVGLAIQAAVKASGLPEGVFSLLFGSGREVGAELVKHPHVKAVGFTGSRAGGTALMDMANARPEPIPVYAEMSSINPVFLMPTALAEKPEAIGTGFVGSLLMGAGQFCTNPGLVIGVEGEDLDKFLAAAQGALTDAATQTMLSPGIFEAYCSGVSHFSTHAKVEAFAQGQASEAPNQCQAQLFVTSAADFLSDETLCEEVFGSASLVIKCKNTDEFVAVAEQLEGQLTATLHLQNGDQEALTGLLPVLERKAGRILCNAYPTGVEVCHAMVHGGPFPATSDARSTSVGSAAINRFLRPVCYQDFPADLLPAALKDENPLGLRRLVNGKNTLAE